MAWFKVDDGFYTSHKVLMIPRQYRNEALGAWLRCGTWSADKMTDGAVPCYVLDDFDLSEEAFEWLIKSGLWDRTDDGIVFHDWAEYQPTRDQLEQKRNSRSEINRKNAEKRWDDAKDMQTECETDAKDMQNHAPEPEPEPEPKVKRVRSSVDEQLPTKTPYSDEFEQFWIYYPRKQAKGKAWEVYKRLRRTRILPPVDDLIRAAQRYSEATKFEPQYQKLGEGWLNGHRWLDELEQQPASKEPPKRQFTVDGAEDV